MRVKYRGATDAEVLAPDKTTSVIRCSVSVCNGTLAAGKVVQMTVQDGAPPIPCIRTCSQGTAHPQRLADDGVSHVATRYNALGQVVSQTEPTATGQEFYTTFPEYDVLGRPTSKVVARANHDGRGNMFTTYAYLGRTTAIQVCGSNDTDTTGCLKLYRTTDSLGRHVETVDAKGSYTRFWYDSTGNAIAIRDANSNVIKATYNALGQRTSAVDPNQGSWSFDYNRWARCSARPTHAASHHHRVRQLAGHCRPRPRTIMTHRRAGHVVDTSATTRLRQGRPRSERKSTRGAAQETLGYDTSARRSHARWSASRDRGAPKPWSRKPLRRLLRSSGASFGNAETLWLRYSKYGH